MRRVTGLALVAATGLAACGGGNALTHAQLVTKANAICRQANQKARGLSAPKTPAQAGQYAAAVARIADQMSAQLGRLAPPKRDAVAFKRYLTDLRAGVHDAERLEAAVKRRDATAVKQLMVRLSASPDDADARGLGFSVCAEKVRPRAG